MSLIIQKLAIPRRILCCSCHGLTPIGNRRKSRWSPFKWNWDASHWADIPDKMRFWYNATAEDVMDHLKKKDLGKIRTDQQFRSSRYDKLGPDLAAATFIVHRGGKVKFEHIPRWTRLTSGKIYAVPTIRDDNYRLEGIDTSGMKLLCEGLSNLRDLQHLKYLKLSSTLYLDDWYLAKLALLSNTLEFLDISKNSKVTDVGLASLYKLRKLKCLDITDCTDISNAEVVCTYLTELNPDLTVIGVDSLPVSELSLQERELKERRFLNLGEQFYSLETHAGTNSESVKNTQAEHSSEETGKQVSAELFSQNRETTQRILQKSA